MRTLTNPLRHPERGYDKRIDNKPAQTDPLRGNVFVDLGFDPQEAAVLKAESQRMILAKLAIKESLIAELAGWIDAKSFTHAEAADILGVACSRVSDVMNRRAQGFTIDALVNMLVRTGKQVHVSVL